MLKKYLNATSITTIVILIVSSLLILKSGIFSKKDVTSYFFEGEINNFCMNDLCLTKEQGSWYIDKSETKIPAETENVEATINKLKEISLDNLISENEEKFDQLGIGGENILLLAINGKSMEIGNIEKAYSGTYARAKEDNRVYKIPIVLDKLNLESEDYWKLKNLTNIPTYQIKKIVANNKEIITDEEGNWKNQKFVEKISQLKALSYIGQATNENSIEYLIETEVGNYNLYLKKVDLGRRKYSYQASRDGNHFFEISSEDFVLLTATSN